jgi:biofilm PGA synthesis N-glycosyltransferase PgaC
VGSARTSAETEASVHASAIVCAYNEERNISHLVDALLAHDDPHARLTEVIVVASGCTDRTVALLREAAVRDSRVQLLIQSRRTGKADALAAGIRLAREEVLLVENADTVPASGTISRLLRPLSHPEVALVCCRPVPANDPAGVTVALGRVLWGIHDRLSRESPKVGEAFAIRRSDAFVPPDIEDDDTFLGGFAVRGGRRAIYVPAAEVFNRVPEHPWELFQQRLRINRQILRLARRTGIVSGAWAPAELAHAVLGYLQQSPRRAPLVLVLAALEASARLVAAVESSGDRGALAVWAPLDSTKIAIEREPVDL